MLILKPTENENAEGLEIIRTDHRRYDYAAVSTGYWYIINRNDGTIYRVVVGSEEDVKGIIARLV